MAKPPRALVRSESTGSKSESESSFKEQLLIRLRAERAACWMVLEQRVLHKATAIAERQMQADLEVEVSLGRLRDLDKEVVVAGGRSLAEEGLP